MEANAQSEQEALKRGGSRDNRIADPHRGPGGVQSYLVATDRDGLRILEEDGRVFQCHEAIADAIYYAEQGSALAIMGAGYNLDCLMLRYQGVDWRDRHNWNCNREVNPYLGEGFNDGMNIYPLEAMFVKVKWRMLDSRASAAEAAAKYSEWITDQYLQGQYWAAAGAGEARQ